MKRKAEYSSDDHSRFAAPDFKEEQFEIGERDANLKSLSPETPDDRGKGPKNYHPSDNKIYERVCDTLSKSQIFDATHIQVTVKGGSILLEGEVETKNDKLMAESLIEALPGVKQVKNKLQLLDGPISGPSEVTIKDLGLGIR